MVFGGRALNLVVYMRQFDCGINIFHFWSLTRVAHMIIVLNPNARTDLVRPEQNRNHLLKAKFTLAKQIILCKLCAGCQETTFLKRFYTYIDTFLKGAQAELTYIIGICKKVLQLQWQLSLR